MIGLISLTPLRTDAGRAGQELVEIGLDPLGPGVFDRLQYRPGAALRILAKDRAHLFEPVIGCPTRMADADLGVRSVSQT